MGVSFFLGLVSYLVIIFGITFWLIKYHSLQCRKPEPDSKPAEIAEKPSQTTDPKPGKGPKS